MVIYQQISECIPRLIIELSVKVRKTQHQNPEFGHTQSDIEKKTCKKSTLAFYEG
jgi:hypothetical protein